MQRFGLLALTAAALAANAQRPAMFRGDAAHTGGYAGGGPAIVGVQWRFPTDGDVTATPVVSGERVFVGSGSGRFYSLDRNTGVEQWSYDAASPIQSSAAVAKGLVFFEARDGSIHALDATSGKRRWRISTGSDLPLPWGHESGDVYIASPTIAGDELFIGSGDGNLYSLNPLTGAVRWKAKTGGRIRVAPAVAGERVFVGAYDGCVYAFDRVSGRRIWKYETKGASLDSRNFGFDRRSIQSSPAVANGTVFVGARDGFLYALDAATGALRWTFDHQVSWVNTSPAVIDGVVYAGSSDAHFIQAVDAVTGKELWRAKSRGGVVWSSPAVTSRFVYWGEGTGFVHVTDRSTGNELSSFRTPSQVHSSPVVDGNLLLVGTGDGGVYAFRLGDTSEVPRRAVFMDSALARTASTNAADINTYLTHRGYEELRAPALAAFMRQHIDDRAPSVVVFAVDAVPDQVLASPDGTSLFRRYLDAGGKIVWLGLPPTIWPVDPAKGQRGGLNEIQWDAPAKLLGVSFADAIFDQRSARATRDGASWGLPARWRASWSVHPTRDMNVLATDDFGLAAAWVKSYGGAPGTGFVNVPTTDLYSIYLAAEHRPAPARR